MMVYAFLLMLIQVAGHGYVADACRELYTLTKDTYPEYAMGCRWAFDTKLDFASGLVVETLGGVTILIATGVVVRRQKKLIEMLAEIEEFKRELFERFFKDSIKYVASLTAFYVLVFLAIGIFVNPYYITSPLDYIYTMIPATLIATILQTQYVTQAKYRRRLRLLCEAEPQLIRLYLQLEHDEAKTIIQVSIIVGLSLITATIAGVIQFINLYPPVIHSLQSFWRIIFGGVTFFVVLLVGYFGGVVWRNICVLGELLDAVTEYHNLLKSKNKSERLGVSTV